MKKYEIPDVEPNPRTGRSVWAVLVDGQHIGRITETLNGYRPAMVTPTDSWVGSERKSREAAMDAIRARFEPDIDPTANPR